MKIEEEGEGRVSKKTGKMSTHVWFVYQSVACFWIVLSSIFVVYLASP